MKESQQENFNLILTGRIFLWRVIFIEFCSYIFWGILADLWRDGKKENEYAKSGKYRADTTAAPFSGVL